ncbi:YbhB/YbcL family Raf kinase inhibitor-like protein [Massilia sp. DJPM01]|uniref:YbhB/YbcL family Raf kinase inhibitor-like protein n=1 Tax=Massilia sp. DJPM01 TaxID=3024404 RepID=UPI00259F8A74|nr:YbhB/YbcL family Raf kinase inhibitor-like protein [Massilia sp. DJPM01]MDM5178991.1 YbhB/YbcL family Raf kinase inhibitor-like protein [Massilia sp. DJPM01]
MRLWSDSFTDGGLIPARCAFAMIDPDQHARLSANRNPHFAWDDVPSGTQSLILFCYDIDAPTVATIVNKEGLFVPEALARADFYHWTLVDIPVAMRSIGEGKFSELVTPHGKPGPLLPFSIKNGTEHQLRQGVNDYTSWFASDPDMAGEYFGYDGPCPPWNDLRVHTYLFCVYALDVPRLALEGRFTGPEARLAIRGHILDEAQMYGVYSLNPDLAATLVP